MTDFPIALWEVDLSGLSICLEKLRNGRIEDLRLYFESHPGEVIRCAREAKVIELNRAARDLLGASSWEEFLAHLDKDLEEGVHSSLKESILAICDGKTDFQGEVICQRITGEKIHVAFKWSVPRNDRETPSRLLVAAMDLTPLVGAGPALRESVARYRAIMEQSADAIFLVDVKSKRVLEANPSFARMLGCSPEEVPSLSLYDFIAADREDIDRRFQALLEGGGSVTFERNYRRKDGTLLEVWVTGTIIAYAGKRVMCTIVRDLTEKKSMEAQVLRSQRLDSIGLLAGGIAHDLNNILTPILINAELLRGRLADHQSQRMLSSIASNAQRGADIVKQVLVFSRGMEGEGNRLLVSPRHLLKELYALAQETFPRSIIIEADIPKDLSNLYGDATQLHQVLLNLCLNARDAMPGGGTLRLTGKNTLLDEAYARMHPEAQPGSFVCIMVEDTGAGIPPSVLPKIFDPFFTTKERGRGAGLGLPTCRAIVDGHGGFIQLNSEVGRGSRFEVFLPASPSEETQVSEEISPLPLGRGESILLAEDDASLLEIAQTALESCSYRVIPAADGVEAVALYAEHQQEIQVVVTDMAMPVMDGFATIRALQRISPQVKVIATSGLDADAVMAQIAGLPVKAFLPKPFTARMLLQTLHEVLTAG